MNQEILSLRKDTAELKNVLLDGTLHRYGERWVALPREVVANSEGIESVIFEIVRPNGRFQPHFFRKWSQAVRLESLTLTLMPGVVTFFYGFFKEGWPVQWIRGGLALLGVLFFHISVNLLNDTEDHLRLLDLSKPLSGSGVLQKGWFTAKQLRKWGLFSLLLGTALGLPAVISVPHILFSVGAFGLVGIVGYSNPPLSLKYRALGDYLIFLLMGPLLSIGFSGAFFHQIDSGTVILGIFFGFLAWADTHALHLSKLDTDQIRNTKTLASKLGFKASRVFLTLLYLLAYLSLLLGLLQKTLSWPAGLAVLLVAPWVIQLNLKIHRASGPVSALLGSIRLETTRIHFWLGIALSVGLFFHSR